MVCVPAVHTNNGSNSRFGHGGGCRGISQAIDIDQIADWEGDQTNLGRDSTVFGAEAGDWVDGMDFLEQEEEVVVRADHGGTHGGLALHLHSCDHLVPEALLLAGPCCGGSMRGSGGRTDAVPVRAARILPYIAASVHQRQLLC